MDFTSIQDGQSALNGLVIESAAEPLYLIVPKWAVFRRDEPSQSFEPMSGIFEGSFREMADFCTSDAHAIADHTGIPDDLVIGLEFTERFPVHGEPYYVASCWSSPLMADWMAQPMGFSVHDLVNGGEPEHLDSLDSLQGFLLTERDLGWLECDLEDLRISEGSYPREVLSR